MSHTEWNKNEKQNMPHCRDNSKIEFTSRRKRHNRQDQMKNNGLQNKTLH